MERTSPWRRLTGLVGRRVCNAATRPQTLSPQCLATSPTKIHSTSAAIVIFQHRRNRSKRAKEIRRRLRELLGGFTRTASPSMRFRGHQRWAWDSSDLNSDCFFPNSWASLGLTLLIVIQTQGGGSMCCCLEKSKGVEDKGSGSG